jgi:hypothetical protein
MYAPTPFAERLRGWVEMQRNWTALPGRTNVVGLNLAKEMGGNDGWGRALQARSRDTPESKMITRTKRRHIGNFSRSDKRQKAWVGVDGCFG